MSTIIIQTEYICRLCMCETDSFYVDLFHNDGLHASMLHSILDLLTIKIISGDGLPSHICSRCQKSLKNFHEFKAISLDSQTILQKHVNNYLDEGDNKVGALSSCEEYVDVDEKRVPTKTRNDSNQKDNQSSRDDGSDESTDSDNEFKCSKDQKPELKLRPTGKYTKIERFKRIEKKFACEICGKMMRPSDLSEHLNFHNGIKSFKCIASDCESTFYSNRRMMRHYKYSHSKSVYQCDFCGRNFKSQQILRKHFVYHKEPTIPCSLCGKLQYTNDSLRKHMMIHTNVRPHECTFCSKAFNSNYNLKVHLRIHTKEKPFSCAKCGVAFGYNSLLKAHSEKQHPEP